MRSGIRKISSRVLEVPQKLATDSQCEVEGICEDVEAVLKRPLRDRHLNVARAHVIHDRETGDMFLPSVHRNVFFPLTDKRMELQLRGQVAG